MVQGEGAAHLTDSRQPATVCHLIKCPIGVGGDHRLPMHEKQELREMTL